MPMPASENCLWLLYFMTSKCSGFSPKNLTFFSLIICFLWLAILALLYWAYPGGHAWGKFYWKQGITKTPHIIPGPRGFPVIGSMNLMSNLAHQRLEAMAKSVKAKRLMAFSLGETRIIVTCNPDVAKEILNGTVFVDRPIKHSANSLMFNQAMGFAPFGSYWRKLRKIAATQFFCPKKIGETQGQRSKVVTQMVSFIASMDNEEFEVREILKRASLNNMMSLVFGRTYEFGSSSNNEEEELSELVQEGYELLGQLNWADHIPCLASLDLQKIGHRCSKLVPRVNAFVARIISQHTTTFSACQTNHDFVDLLLSLTTPNKLSDSDMIAVLWVRLIHYIPYLCQFMRLIRLRFSYNSHPLGSVITALSIPSPFFIHYLFNCKVYVLNKILFVKYNRRYCMLFTHVFLNNAGNDI